ncbi:MAG: manganese efflux pump [Clostridia bacterium]|nr:manganese efflux pump [Clostridia bacterium]
MVELVVIAVGLAMDAFAVAVCKGLNMRKLDYKQTALIALFFGGFQAGMPLVGWFIGSRFAHYIESIDHWVTFILLAIIGGKMILEAVKGEDESEECGGNKLNLKELTALAIATSIDALAVGVAFALEYDRNTVFVAVALIGIITAGLSAIGVFIGHKFGAKYKNKAELAGGLVLVLMGVKFLLEGLGIIGG